MLRYSVIPVSVSTAQLLEYENFTAKMFETFGVSLYFLWATLHKMMMVVKTTLRDST